MMTETFRERALRLMEAITELQNAARSFAGKEPGDEFAEQRLARAAMAFTAAARTLTDRRKR